MNFKIKFKTLVIVSLLLTSQVFSQTVTETPLYPGAIPGAKPSSVKERVTFIKGRVNVFNVVNPTLTKYSPVIPNGIAVIICPGGGYAKLAIDDEGVEVAKRFNEAGITAFVLKYRMPDDSVMMNKNVGPLQDVQQAIRTVRKSAGSWNIDPARIGIMGFSAGGHLASTAATHFYIKADPNEKDTTSVRPNFAVLIYPVISFDKGITHQGSRVSLVGNSPSETLVKQFSNELQVTKETPPAFLVHAANDMVVPVENSIRFAQECVKNKVRVEMHLYPEGGHGFGLHNKTTKEIWFDLLLTWIAELF